MEKGMVITPPPCFPAQTTLLTLNGRVQNTTRLKSGTTSGRETTKRVTDTIRDFFESFIANTPDDIRDLSDYEFGAAIENESSIFTDSSCIENREEFLKKHWSSLFGSSRGYTQDDLVLQQQDQNLDLLARLGQCSERFVNLVAEEPENCYFDALRSKYQAATPKPAYWHKDANPDERLHMGKHQPRER
ncbi:hypothetical protein P9112_003557 [Eukaryota sp. TZLM1-RC]